LLYLLILLISTLTVAAWDINLMTAFSSVAASMGNVGPEFGLVGSMDNYGHLPGAVKWVLTADMLFQAYIFRHGLGSPLDIRYPRFGRTCDMRIQMRIQGQPFNCRIC